MRSGINLLLDIDHDNITQNNTFFEPRCLCSDCHCPMITLSTIATISQANTGDESECDADQINDTQASDFRTDLDLVQEDLENAGFHLIFAFLTRATSIFDTLENAGFADETLLGCVLSLQMHFLATPHVAAPLVNKPSLTHI
ncbi:MAG: hypothetical protein R3A45_08640 [Bdellovibrionota bacterium]